MSSDETIKKIEKLPGGWCMAKVGRRGPIEVDFTTTDLQNLIADLQSQVAELEEFVGDTASFALDSGETIRRGALFHHIDIGGHTVPAGYTSPLRAYKWIKRQRELGISSGKPEQ